MDVYKEFAKLFPKSLWTNEEIVSVMFTPDEADIPHIRAERTLKITCPIEKYAKDNNMVDLNNFLKGYQDLFKNSQ